MANKQSSNLENSILRFFLMPFQRGFVIVLVVSLLVAMSVGVMIWLTNINDLNVIATELASQSNQKNVMFNGLSKSIYSTLNTVFFDWTSISQIITQPQLNDKDPGYAYELFVYKNIDFWIKFSKILKILSYRVATLIYYFVFVGMMMYLVAAIDGAARRSIRRDSIGRESASIYHHLKYYNYMILALGIEAYLAAPLPIPEYAVPITLALSAIMYAWQFSYYKKYL